MLLIAYALMLLALAALPAMLVLRNLPQFRLAKALEPPPHPALSPAIPAAQDGGEGTNLSSPHPALSPAIPAAQGGGEGTNRVTYRQAVPNRDDQDSRSNENLLAISVLIPARNEAAGIAATVNQILANKFEPFEVLVMDDASTDRTGEIVEQLAATDSRVRLLKSKKLPNGWNGKQHACWQLAQAARYDCLLFLDADVRLSVDALARIAAELESAPRDLLSGFPFQVTETWSEKLLIPLMHVVLLGYLPLDRMRASTDPAFGAGCGQLFIARKSAYFDCDGHQSICGSRHDGLKLPRAFRNAGLITDVFDAGDIARCRMYHSARQVVQGLLKNATEGIAQPKLIAVFSVLLLGGQSLPIFSLAHAIYWHWPQTATIVLLVATLVSYLPRVLTTAHFRQSWLGAVLNPLAVAVFVGLQWWALMRQWTGLKPIAWRGRS